MTKTRTSIAKERKGKYNKDDIQKEYIINKKFM